MFDNSQTLVVETLISLTPQTVYQVYVRAFAPFPLLKVSYKSFALLFRDLHKHKNRILCVLSVNLLFLSFFHHANEGRIIVTVQNNKQH